MGAEFLLAANFAIACLLAAAFLAIAIYDDQRLSARWFALGYALGAAFFGVELFTPLAHGGLIAESLGYVAFLAALVAFNTGVSRFYDVRQPVRLIAVVLVIGLAAKIFSDGMPRESVVRMMIYQAPYFILQSIGALLVVRSRHCHRLDYVLAGLLGLTALHYLAKPFLAQVTGGPGATPADYTSTLYAQIGQSAAAVLAVSVALTLFVILVRNLLAALTQQSETDMLSQTLNRRGFERHLELYGRTGGQPLSLVVADLDHFKTVNDTYGHGVGDAVIVAFSRTLREATKDSHFVGRIGGEEFAVLLPGYTVSAARLFAEDVRLRMQHLAIEGLREDERVTASFGVAERSHGEPAVSLHKRADAALYAAKDGGRDCVRAALPLTVKGGGGQVTASRAGQSS
ncbi:GGDEF domain-containing protein [Aliihoeflea sp. PC F10.4]